MADLPWSPATGKTALYVVASNASRVLCADKEHPAFRYLFSAEGLLLAQGGQALTLDGFPPLARPAQIEEADRAVLALLPMWPDATLAGLADYAAIAPEPKAPPPPAPRKRAPPSPPPMPAAPVQMSLF